MCNVYMSAPMLDGLRNLYTWNKFMKTKSTTNATSIGACAYANFSLLKYNTKHGKYKSVVVQAQVPNTYSGFIRYNR